MSSVMVMFFMFFMMAIFSVIVVSAFIHLTTDYTINAAPPSVVAISPPNKPPATPPIAAPVAV
jgi:hypothetical protein